MLRTTAIGLAALSLTFAALTPALADVPQCEKQPNADTCPTMGPPSPGKASEQGAPRNFRHTRYHAPERHNKG